MDRKVEKTEEEKNEVKILRKNKISKLNHQNGIYFLNLYL